MELVPEVGKTEADRCLVNLDGAELDLMTTLRSSMVSKVILSVASGLLKDIEDMLGSCG